MTGKRQVKRSRPDLILAGFLGMVAAILILWFTVPRKGATTDGEERKPPESALPRKTHSPASPPVSPPANPVADHPKPKASPGAMSERTPSAETAEEEPGWEFSKEDIQAAEGFVIEVDPGEYAVDVGQEFEVSVSLTAPPLQAMVLPMNFDGRLLEAIPGSGRAVGPTFRKGVEFFVKPKGGKMTLFCATFPGMKNILPVDGEIVATFGMRAKAAGRTRIEIDQELMKFVQGTGVLLKVQPADGLVVVR